MRMVRYWAVGWLLLLGTTVGAAELKTAGPNKPEPKKAEPKKAEPTMADLNDAFGLSLWKDDNLWDDVDVEAAQRLGWPQESHTRTQSSYRSYPFQGVKALGALPYSLALYGETGKVSTVSMFFVNRGDYVGVFAGSTPPLDPKKRREYDRDARKKQRDFPEALDKDAKTLQDTLQKLLGEPRHDHYGDTTATRERVLRWDWKGHAILLTVARGEYVGVRILPVKVADRAGRMEHVLDSVMKARLATNVQHRANGDIVVTNIPMVDQGQKGFCVPATWERYLRYMGLHVDMYVLAMAGQTAMGGGTPLEAMVDGAKDLVSRNGWRLEKTGHSLNSTLFAETIDQGLPVMWGMYEDPDLSYDLTDRAKDRLKVTNWDKWRDGLKSDRRAARRIKINKVQAHMCLIIGHNPKTLEIAISDSWGPDFAERWLTDEEANAISQHEMWVIKW